MAPPSARVRERARPLQPYLAVSLYDRGFFERLSVARAVRGVWGHNTWSGIAYCMVRHRILYGPKSAFFNGIAGASYTSRHAVPRRIVYGHDRALYGQSRILHGPHRILYGQHRILYGPAPAI